MKVDDGGMAEDKTLLDYFAGRALAGLTTLNSGPMLAVISEEAASLGESRTEQTFARLAYGYAEAMVAEKRRRESAE